MLDMSIIIWSAIIMTALVFAALAIMSWLGGYTICTLIFGMPVVIITDFFFCSLTHNVTFFYASTFVIIGVFVIASFVVMLLDEM